VRTAARLALALALAAGCDPDADDDARAQPFPWKGVGGKTDPFGRSLLGIADDYDPDPRLRNPEIAAALDRDVRARRAQAWRTVSEVLEPVPMLGLLDAASEHEEIVLEGVPEIPRWETWYGIDDITRMFGGLVDAHTPAQRRAREPFAAAELEAIFAWNAAAIERSDRWPLERYLEHVVALGECPTELSAEACAAMVQQQQAGAASGINRIVYSPAAAAHILEQYAAIVACDPNAPTRAEDDNFTTCFDREFPPGAVLVKAQWDRVGFGRDLPAFDTDATALQARLAAGDAAWPEAGDRRVDPSPDRIYTIALSNGAVYRLTGLHIMTKELRHWQWITLWWSDRPDEDFGEDRDDEIADPWASYKMCVATAYDEADPDPSFPDAPSLAEALAATAEGGAPSWCSNPYLEHGAGNAKTNCIGCHQHGGTAVDIEAVITDDDHFPDNGRAAIRDVFPADYLYSFDRVDDFAGAMRRELEHAETTDASAVDVRVRSIDAMVPDHTAGALVFAENCTKCHGEHGEGTSIAPSLFVRVPARDDDELLLSLLLGRGLMPSWADTLDDRALADLRAYLRSTFG
jgi:mono/diheme cytochrome c family protein